MKSNLANYACGSLLLGALATASAQTTWNYFISDAGGGSSLVTWNVSGGLAIPPGSLRLTTDRMLSASVSAPGIFADSYAASGGDLLAPDGSYIHWGIGDIWAPIVSYAAYNTPGGGNDTFGLLAWLGPRGAAGITLLYQPGTESALIPIDSSWFNPGTYQSEVSGFDTLCPNRPRWSCSQRAGWEVCCLSVATKGHSSHVADPNRGCRNHFLDSERILDFGIEPTGVSRSGQLQFVRQRRLAPGAHADR